MMIRNLLALTAIVLPTLAGAQSLEAARNLRAGSVIGAADIAVSAQIVNGALTDEAQVIGQELRMAIYAGAPIRPDMLRAPAIIDRNQIINLVYQSGPLEIRTEGRALERGAVDDFIRVMNLGSKATLQARINANGEAVVLPK